MGIQGCSNQGAGPFWLNMGILRHFKISSHEQLAGIHWYLAWSILGTWRCNIAEIKYLGVKNGRAPGDIILYIQLTLTKSHEPLAGMHFKLAWIILRTKRFKLKQMQSLVS